MARTTQLGEREFSASKVVVADDSGTSHGMLAIYMDTTDQRQLEAQLSHAQKLESIGSLAAGIAHEINTPTQYVSDNTQFLKREFTHLMRVIETYQGMLSDDAEALSWAERRARATKVQDECDFEFLREEVPAALEQSIEGVERIAEIVRAMKEFSHPGESDLAPVDLNSAIAATATVCRNRWKYCSDLTMDLDPNLPQVPCLIGEINQVILNLIVNAADAINSRQPPEGGKITIRSFSTSSHAVVEVTDNGGGIPEEVQHRIFEPFFTTKQVGQGTGQGLAISRNVVMKKHGGDLSFEVIPGEGTTFTMRLRLQQADTSQEAA